MGVRGEGPRRGDAFYFVTYDYDVDVGYYTAYASDGSSTWETWQSDEAIKRVNSIDGRECFDPVVQDTPNFMDAKGTETTQVSCTGGVGRHVRDLRTLQRLRARALTDG
jgi:hypothetical protein